MPAKKTVKETVEKEEKAAAKKAPAKKTAVKKETTKKETAEKTTEKKTAVKKTAAKKETAEKKTAAKKAPAKKTAEKKAPAKKAAAKKTTAKKAAEPVVAKMSVEDYEGVIRWKKGEAHAMEWLYIEVNAGDLLTEKEAGIDNLDAVCNAMLNEMLEGDFFVTEPDEENKVSSTLTVRYYCDNLSADRKKYFAR